MTEGLQRLFHTVCHPASVSYGGQATKLERDYSRAGLLLAVIWESFCGFTPVTADPALFVYSWGIWLDQPEIPASVMRVYKDGAMFTLLRQYPQQGKQLHLECVGELHARENVVLDKKQEKSLPGKTSCTVYVLMLLK